MLFYSRWSILDAWEIIHDKQICNSLRVTSYSILLHMWGFLGYVTWALSRNNAVVHCYVSLATQQFKRRAYLQHCYARDNTHGDVSMVTGLLSTDFYWFVGSQCLEIAEYRRVCVWLRTPVGWKTELVSGNCERSTWVWKLSDCKNESLCWEITRRGPVEGVLCGTSLSVDAQRVFGEWLVVFNCSVLSFWKGNKLPSWIEPPVRYNIFN
jgi:hypothetical protein